MAKALLSTGIVIVSGFAAATLFAGPAAAEPHVLGGSWSKSSIKQHCDAAGGSFSAGKSGGYGCMAPGGYVTCNKSGTCVGDSTDLVRGGDKGTQSQVPATPEAYLAPRDRGVEAGQPASANGHPGVGQINGIPPNTESAGNRNVSVHGMQSGTSQPCVGACAPAPNPQGHPGGPGGHRGH